MRADALIADQGGRVFARVQCAQRPWERMRGLLGRPRLSADQALLIEPCNSVHTFGMRYPIDVLFLDGELRVLAIAADLRPGRLAWSWRARRVLEMTAGSAQRLAIGAGHRLSWKERAS